jgi:3-deoxy-7-phosphoheptulonate synthase
VTCLPMKSYRDIFNACASGNVEFGVVPVENSLSGSIHENFDLLQEYDLKIIGEVTIRIKHALIANGDVQKDMIRTILASPPAFSQCKNFMDQSPGVEPLTVKANTSAVRQLKESCDTTVAAIGSAMAADLFGLKVIEDSIEDNPRNFTRFAIIAKEYKGHKKVSKTSIIFSTGNKPGALFEVMKVFSSHEINLVKLESRPILGQPWEYMFYADLEADILSDALAPMMAELRDKSEVLRILGRY